MERDRVTQGKELGLPPKDMGGPQKGGSWSGMMLQGDARVGCGMGRPEAVGPGGGKESGERGRGSCWLWQWGEEKEPERCLEEIDRTCCLPGGGVREKEEP